LGGGVTGESEAPVERSELRIEAFDQGETFSAKTQQVKLVNDGDVPLTISARFRANEHVRPDPYAFDETVDPNSVKLIDLKIEPRGEAVATADLTPLFAPRGVAVLGASRHPAKLGHRLVQNLLDPSFPGDVFPVNPSGEAILGRAAVARVEEPQLCDRHVPDA